MLSNKWTFSLTSLVVILALAFVVPSAMADPFSVGLSVAAATDDANPDVSGVDGIQIQGQTAVSIRIATGQVVDIAGTQTGDAAALLLIKDIASGHFTVTAFNSYGGTVGAANLGVIAHSNTDAPNGRNFSMPLPEPGTGVVKVIVSVKAKVFEVADPTTFLTDGARNDDGRNAAASITINYVEENQRPLVVFRRCILFGEPVIRCYLLRRLRRTSSSCSVNSRKRSRRIMWMPQTQPGAILSL